MTKDMRSHLFTQKTCFVVGNLQVYPYLLVIPHVFMAQTTLHFRGPKVGIFIENAYVLLTF